MLLEYGFKNYFSFREGAVISFKLDGKVPKSISGDRDYATVMAVKGANASGKTQVLKAITFLIGFVRWSFVHAESKNPVIIFNSFYKSEDPSEFYIEFEINDAHYRYELVATDEKVIRETVFIMRPKKVKYLERIDNEITIKPPTSASLESIILGSHVSVISTLAQHKTGLLEDFYKFFERFYSNVSYTGLREEPHDIRDTAKLLHQNEAMARFVKDFISSSDAGVCNIVTRETAGADGKPVFIPYFVHKVGEHEHEVHYHAESSGTKALYKLLPLAVRCLATGALLVLDEIDMHLHPGLLPKLINLFADLDVNREGAQLLFSTHDLKVLDFLGRYRTYLVNKENNESYAFRLDEIPGDILRNDRPISPVYEEGRIGGVPRL
jgi:uncharacterized protein